MAIATLFVVVCLLRYWLAGPTLFEQLRTKAPLQSNLATPIELKFGGISILQQAKIPEIPLGTRKTPLPLTFVFSPGDNSLLHLGERPVPFDASRLRRDQPEFLAWEARFERAKKARPDTLPDELMCFFWRVDRPSLPMVADGTGVAWQTSRDPDGTVRCDGQLLIPPDQPGLYVMEIDLFVYEPFQRGADGRPLWRGYVRLR